MESHSKKKIVYQFHYVMMVLASDRMEIKFGRGNGIINERIKRV